MNIIFGDAVNQLPSEYIVLELDTFLVKPSDHRVTTWCVVEFVPTDEFTELEKNKRNHSELMAEYRAQNWDKCLELLDALDGLWSGEMDSFYDEIKKRITRFKTTKLEPDWDGTIVKHSVPS